MRNVICMKWGTRYDPSYVNILASMVRRHLSAPHRFVCFTDDPAGIDPRVETRPIAGMTHDLSKPERGWMKLSILGKETGGLEGTALFLDLDIVVLGDLDPFFELPGAFRIIRDWNLRGGVIGNSSVFRFELGKHEDVLRNFLDREAELRKEFRNEQAYLSAAMQKKGVLDYWPADWCLSFKRHSLRAFPASLFLEPKRPGPNTKIVVFHGYPNPHQVLGGWHNLKKLRWVRPARWINDNWNVDD